ncbi:41702_t:CDS:1, partial [Gigaspora margarita]
LIISYLMEEETQYMNFLNDQVKKTKEFNRTIVNQEVLVQYTSVEEKTKQDLSKKKKILLVSECRTMDYRIEEILEQAKHFRENHKKMLKLFKH